MLQIRCATDVSTFSKLITELTRKNKCADLGRVRLAIFRNDQNSAEFVIEAFSLSENVNQWNEKGFVVDVYPYSRKNADAFSNLKTANFLPYVLAELFAKERNIDDAIVLNAFNNLADSSKANIFLIKENEIFTPALNQGCVSGVMRRFLLDKLKRNNYRIQQGGISIQQLLEADEVFLTNSIYDIRWVEKFKEKVYSSDLVFSIYEKIILPFY